MLKYDYEGREEHKSIHQDLINNVRELQHKVIESDKALIDEHIEFLEHWLTEHILTEDLKLGTYLSQVM